MVILETMALSKRYGSGAQSVAALDEVEEGKFVAIVGTSGSGKSTLPEHAGRPGPSDWRECRH